MINRKSFIVGVKSTKLSLSEKNFLKKYRPWGVILFSRNINNIDQAKKLTFSIRKIFNDPNYPILIDQEGGRVNRLKKIISFDNLTAEFFGKKFSKNHLEFKIFFKLFIDKTSFLLNSIGVNINTMPVLDLKIKGSSNVIGDRSYSNDPEIVSKIGDICIDFFRQNSIGTVIKHIPGHGLAKVDSHHYTPVVNKKINYLLKKDFFAMTAHIIFNNIDKTNTVTHSKKIIQLIRKKIGFKNILISDDLSMKSLKGKLKDNTINSFKAGCNLALHCNGNMREMEIIANNSPFINNFIIKKTSQFYKILS